MESIPCRAVIEERNRLAREIHDTLVQEFAGILLHLEAVNGLGLRVNAPNSWLAQESSPNLVGRRARDATRPVSQIVSRSTVRKHSQAGSVSNVADLYVRRGCIGD